MVEAVLLTEVGKLVAEKLGSHVWDKVMSRPDIDSQIKELQGIKNTIEATLLDADLAQTCSYSQRDFCEKLEGVLAKIINFQDVKATKAKQKELMDGSTFTKKVRTFCSSSNQLVASYRDAREIKNITGELSQIARNHSQFGTTIGSSSVKQTQPLSNEFGSNLSTDMVVGRDGDRDNMLRSLSIASVGTQILSVASIVGMGGVGKTTLAQYIYNDERVKGLFDVQFWVSATQDFNVKDVLQKLLASATDEIPLHCEMDQLENRVLREIAGKKFLLVLDSIWDHDSLRAKWLQLSSLLRAGSQGSIVLLTTRSEAVAKIMDTQDPYVLDDLQEGDCWDLFKHIAYTQWHEPGVEAIGKEISKMCPKVPLVIRVIGSLLAGKFTVPEWRAFQDDQLANFASYGGDVMGTLKLSYDQLDVGLKLCVAFCSLFPKGYLYKKTDVIRLWIAMGYVKQVYANQSLEDAAEKYLLCLIKRGFFRPMRKYEQNLSEYFDMHNLMHDLALSIAGFNYKMADSSTDELDERVCHVSYTPTNSGWDDELNSKNPSPWKVPSSLFRIKQLQSFLLPLPGPFVCENTRVSLAHDVFLSRFQSLRSLRIHGLGIKKLPKRLGDLLQLRYLDLSNNSFHKLPHSITQLVNLYVINLSYCKSLKELPRDISKLVMLRHLCLKGCDSLSHMPKELARLIQLETLDRFVVNNSLSGSDADFACGLEDLLQFDNLKGLLHLYVIGQSKNMVLESKTAKLENKENIKHLYIKFRDSTKQDEMVLNNLRPNAKLRGMNLMNYAGERLPRWMGDPLFCWLPNLVIIRIYNCKGCKYLCDFGRFSRLRVLELAGLESLEYIENNGGSKINVTPVNELSLPPLFPYLRDLTLLDMPKLKGWRSVADTQPPTQDKVQHHLLNWMPIFPILDNLSIDLELILSMAGLLPILASVESLCILGKVPKSISTAETTTVPSNVSTRLRRPPVVLLNTYFPKLYRLTFRRESHIKDFPEEFRDILSLQCLEVYDCMTLEAIPEWIDSLISLRSLHIRRCPRLTSLPQEISNLSNLKSLVVAKCSKQLAKRCSEPTGEDWPKIQHIPNIRIEPADDEDGDVSNCFLNLDELFEGSSILIARSRS